jgi:hypothetical protein
MRHLKAYRIFESKELDNLSDVMLEFFDDNGFSPVPKNLSGEEVENYIETGVRCWEINPGDDSITMYNLSDDIMISKVDEFLEEESERIASLTGGDKVVISKIERHDQYTIDVTIKLLDPREAKLFKRTRLTNDAVRTLSSICTGDIDQLSNVEFEKFMRNFNKIKSILK